MSDTENEEKKEIIYIQTGGTASKGMIAGIVVGSLVLISFLIYLGFKKYIVDKPKEAQKAIFDAIKFTAKFEGYKANNQIKNIGAGEVEKYQIVFSEIDEIFSKNKKKKSYKFEKDSEKINKKLESFEKKQKEKLEKVKVTVGGGLETQKELQNICDNINKMANKEPSEKKKDENDLFQDKILEYDFVEGVIVDILVNKIQKSFEKKRPVEINKKFLIKRIREHIEQKYKMFLNCNLSANGGININSEDPDNPLNTDQIVKKMKSVIDDIKKTVNMLKPEIIYQKMGIKKGAVNVCKSLPKMAFLGIPFLTHKSLLFLSKRANKNFGIKNESGIKISNTGNLLVDAEKTLCEKLIEAILLDLLTPVRNIFIENMDKIVAKLDEPDELDESNQHKGGGLIGEGTYGCIFKPDLTCDGNESNKKSKFVSKLIIAKKWKIQKEFNISSAIKRIKNYQDYFVPLLNICPVNLNQIKTQGKDDCKLISKKRSTNHVSFLAKMEYINMISFNDFITGNTNINNFINFLKLLPPILEGIDLMVNKKIVHFDMHGGNIIVNKETNSPMIIDFGLSFFVKKFKREELKNTFFIVDAHEWSIYPPEIHYLSFMIAYKRHMNFQEIKEFTVMFCNKHRSLNTFQNIISNKTVELFKQKLIFAFTEYKKMKINDAVKYIIKNSWKTWDTHMVSYLYLNYFKIFNVNNLLINNFNKSVVYLLLGNISPNFKERLTPIQLKRKFKKSMKYLSPYMLLQVKNNFDANDILIKKTIKNEEKKSFIIRNKIEKKLKN